MNQKHFQEVIIRGGFDSINISHFRAETIKKGKELTQHLFNVEEIKTAMLTIIKGQILRTVTLSEKSYTIQLEFDPARNFVDGRCYCVAGISASCKHSAALYHYINNERSVGCTDTSQVPNQHIISTSRFYINVLGCHWWVIIEM